MERVYRVARGSRVVERGGARELHVDGTLASYYEPGRATTGSVWDALAAGLVAVPAARRRAVLLLGLGGGSAARVVRALAPRARIVAVEIDPEVVALARSHFDLDRLGVEVVVDDARRVLARARGRFDAVLEDVFVGVAGDAAKPPGFPDPALGRAERLLAPGGVLASNTLDEAPAVARAMAKLLPAVVRIDVADYDNRIFVGGGAGLTAQGLRAALARDPVLASSLPNLSFRTVAR